MRSVLALAVLLPFLPGAGAPAAARDQEAGPPAPLPEGDAAARDALKGALAEGGVLVDFDARAVALDVRVLVKEDLLEYVLVAPGGAAHEALFQTDVQPSLLNTALLALGVEPGANATWERIDPPPTLEERRAGKKPYRIHLPVGDGFLMYVAWREKDETYLYRLEDLIANLRTARAMERHRWVFLGSAFLDPKEPGDAPVFAADAEGNLINLAFFQSGHTLLSAALQDCEDQSIWVANPWLLPERGQPVRLMFAHASLAELPAAWKASLPVVAPPAAVDDGGLPAGEDAGDDG